MQGRLLMMPSSSQVLDHQLIFHIMYGLGQFYHRQNKGEERRGKIWQKKQQLLSKHITAADGKRQDNKSWEIWQKKQQQPIVSSQKQQVAVVSRKQQSRVSVAVEWSRGEQQQKRSGRVVVEEQEDSILVEQQQEQQVVVIGVVGDQPAASKPDTT